MVTSLDSGSRLSMMTRAGRALGRHEERVRARPHVLEVLGDRGWAGAEGAQPLNHRGGIGLEVQVQHVLVGLNQPGALDLHQQ